MNAGLTKRQFIEEAIDHLISLLDAMDGDPDFESDSDREADPGDMDYPGFLWGGSEDGGPAHSGR